MLDADGERRARKLATMLASCALTIGALVVVGHVTGSSSLIRLDASLQGLSVLTAVAMMLMSTALIAAAGGRERVVQVALFATLAIVGSVLIAYVLYGEDRLGIAIEAAFPIPGDACARMSAGTALVLLLLCVGLAARRHAFASDVAAGLALLVTGTALLGTLYGVEDLYALPIFATMALHTAFGLFLLAIATLTVEPRVGWSSIVWSTDLSGAVTRRRIALLFTPALIGWFLRQGTLSHQLGTGTALALLVILTIVPMILLVLRDGRAQLALETERRRSASAQASLTLDLENRLARKAEELERESEERSRAEAAMYRSQRVEAIGQLTGGIAHDFNNLLAAISGNLELMLRRLPEGHAARRYAVTAASAVGKGAKLAGQLLAFSRSEKLTIQPTEMAPALMRARELIGNALGPSIDLLLEYPQERLWASTDPDQLELAILNLAVNAREAMPHGGTLRIECGLRQARPVGGGDERWYASIRVVDDGVGMEPDVLARAIEPFFTTRERGKGSGLGLAQVYGFVRQCEGDLLIESAPGRGTTVEILLPRTDAPAAGGVACAPAGTRSTTAVEARRLLVVDDDDAVRGVLVELLRDAGFDVVEASGGVAAMDVFDVARPDAAVIDFLMPGLNGAQLARILQTRVPRLPIVFVSGYSDTVALEGVSGATVLRKPFQAEALVEAVTDALRATA